MEIWPIIYLAVVFLIIPYFIFFPMVRWAQNKIKIHKADQKPSKLLYFVSGTTISVLFGLALTILLVRLEMGYEL